MVRQQGVGMQKEQDFSACGLGAPVLLRAASGGGDQAIFVRSSVFRELGGFLPLPVMEDLEFMTRLRRHGHNIRILAMSVRTSARRHLREGVLRCTLRNLFLRLLYHCGVRPSLLAALYRRHGV